MPAHVEHNEKVYEILKHALDIFIEEGYEDTTFQKIADRAQITRTALYQYFRNKLDIFHYSLQIFIRSIEREINTILKEKKLDAADKLNRIINTVFDKIEENRQLLGVVLDFLINVHDDIAELNYHLRRRTIRFRHIVNGLLIDGMESGELRQVNLKAINDMVFGILESAIFELAVFRRTSLEHLRPSCEGTINLLRV